MLRLDKEAALVSNFWLKKFNKQYYLLDTHYKNVIFEPYVITKKEFNIAERLTGEKTLGEIISDFGNGRSVYDFLESMVEINAIEYQLIQKISRSSCI